MPPTRVVLDTNTVLRPLVNPCSSDSCIFQQWQDGHIIPLTSDETEQELLRKLRELKPNLGEQEIYNLAGPCLDYCTKLEIPDPPPTTPQCRDPSDQMFLTLSYHAGADALVSKDRSLLYLKAESDVRILCWREFIIEILHT